MELIDLERDLHKKDAWLFVKLAERKDLIIKSAQAEHDYRVALESQILRLKADGHPVTLIPDLARGDKVVAKLKLERDIAKGISDACRQSILAIQSSMNGLQTLIANRRAEMNLR